MPIRAGVGSADYEIRDRELSQQILRGNVIALSAWSRPAKVARLLGVPIKFVLDTLADTEVERGAQ